ncbi:uncharacterized protein [Amphiura filiformis]|uniref:uncharacterized protein n=1 Tax=Amphiura filiformis TaxID=82378 RepID=UPI003B225FC5
MTGIRRILPLLTLLLWSQCGSSTDPGQVRLVGGSNSNEGRVQVFYNDTWGTVCNDLWDNNDAMVVCRQLGLSSGNAEAVNYPQSRESREGTEQIWLDDVGCSGSENALHECRHSGWGVYQCKIYNQGAGVICKEVNGFKTSQYLEEFECFLDDVCLVPAKTVFLGDFNIHVDQPTKPEVIRFCDTLSAHGLHQYVQEPTHISGHILDLVISRIEDRLVSNCCVLPSLGSDHKIVDCVFDYAKPIPQKMKSTVRNFKKMDKCVFSSDLTLAVGGIDFRGTVDEMLEQLESSITCVLDAHAPPQTRSRSLRPRFPWYNEEINDARCKRRKLERKWRKNKTNDNHVAYVDQCNIVNKLIQTAKEVYYNDELEFSDCKNMFGIMNKLLNKNVKSLPSCDSMSELSNSFAQFFINKVAKIRQELVSVSDRNHDNCVIDSNIVIDVEQFDTFKPVSAEDIEKTVLASSNKSCVLDTLPMWLCKDNIKIMCQALEVVVNKSFCSGEFPSKLREAVVCPVLKKSTLDKNVLNNYRPVSNIRYYSKIIEKIASVQLQNHLHSHGLQEEFQSAYRAQHSTETALLRVKTDIMTDMDRGNAVFVVLLDLSAAFDTVDHQILLDRLSTTFNITGMALRWIKSYLQGRSFRVSIGGDLSVSEEAEESSDAACTASGKYTLEFGVPQGSVLGPLFLCYIPTILAQSFVSMALPITFMLMTFSFIWHLIQKLMELPN